MCTHSTNEHTHIVVRKWSSDTRSTYLASKYILHYTIFSFLFFFLIYCNFNGIQKTFAIFLNYRWKRGNEFFYIFPFFLRFNIDFYNMLFAVNYSILLKFSSYFCCCTGSNLMIYLNFFFFCRFHSSNLVTYLLYFRYRKGDWKHTQKKEEKQQTSREKQKCGI